MDRLLGSSQAPYGGRLPYKYSPISGARSIRLIEVLPSSKKSAQVRCRINKHSRDSVPPYEAISYTWGDAAKTNALLCGDVHYLLVPRNCYRALRAARSARKVVIIWIDYVCIDQHNLLERNAQVAAMDDVYRNAAGTLIYVGEFSRFWHSMASVPSYISAGLRRLSYVCRNLVYFIFHMRRCFSIKPRRSRDEDSWELLPISEMADDHSLSRTLAAQPILRSLFSRQWFIRMWVVQELVLSKNPYLVVGSKRYPWHDIEILHESRLPYIMRLHRLLIADYHVPIDRPLEDYDDIFPRRLRYVPDYGAQDPQDRPAFGAVPYWRLLDMLVQMRSFRCSDPRDRLYALLSLFEKPIPALLTPDYSKSLSDVYTDIAAFLIAHDIPAVMAYACGIRQDRELPTWVPDWRINGEVSVDHDQYGAGDVQSQRQIISRRQGSILFLRGVLIDIIKTQKPIVSRRKSWFERRYLAGSDTKDKSVADNGVFHTVGRRKVYGPTSAHRGDAICAVVGFPWLLVLRQESHHWLFVGRCVIPDLMNGQAFETYTWSDVQVEKLPSGSKLQDFEIW